MRQPPLMRSVELGPEPAREGDWIQREKQRQLSALAAMVGRKVP